MEQTLFNGIGESMRNLLFAHFWSENCSGGILYFITGLYWGVLLFHWSWWWIWLSRGQSGYLAQFLQLDMFYCHCHPSPPAAQWSWEEERVASRPWDQISQNCGYVLYKFASSNMCKLTIWQDNTLKNCPEWSKCQNRVINLFTLILYDRMTWLLGSSLIVHLIRLGPEPAGWA